MAKYENIRALAKKQLQAVTESSDRWKAFLRTAAIAYNYSFPNQLLIHEQSPTATAVADIAYWNNNAGRWVKRGAHGIAVFDTRANSSRLRYLFDISDTIPRAEIPEALPWVITDQNWRPVWDKIVADNHADSIQSALLMLSTSCVAQRSAMFTTALGKAIDGSSLQWAKPDEQRQLFIQLITQSCLYMAALRCGVDTARLDLSALESVNQFDTNRITLCLGSACQQAARPLMQQIGSITREIDSVARAEKVRYYGDKQEETNNTKEVNNGVHDGERLPNPGADAERAADAGDRQVRQPAAEFSAGERADGVRRDAAGGNTVPASGGDGQRSTPANRADDADADAAEHRPEPADRPDVLDAVDERLAGPSRGTGDAADLQPVIQEPQAESDTTPSAFSVPISDLPPLSDELILGLLAKESSSRADNAAILEYFNEHPDLAERSAFCKHCYKQIYTYLFVDDHTVGFIRHDMYLELWEGNYLTKTAQVNLTSHYTAPCPTIKDLWMALNNQRDKRSKEIALALRIFATGSMQAFAQPTNVDMSNRLICFNIQSLGEQLKPVAMLSMLEYINTAVMSNERNDPKAATWVYFDEIYLLLRDSLSANFLYTSWKRFRKYNAYATGITQNVQDCLTNDTAYAMLANSEFVVMLRQTKDIDSVVELYGLSEPQRKYLLLAQPGEGIIKMGNSLIPFNNPQPKDTKTYKLLTTKPGEME